MRIEDEKLIDLLVEETGQSKGKVKDQLDQLKNRIMRAARTGGVVEISDFGTFATKNNILDFKPSRQLKTEINQKYAGMRAIELMEAYKVAGTEVPIDERRYEPPPPAAADRKIPQPPPNKQDSRDASQQEPPRRNTEKSSGYNGNFEQEWQEQKEKEKDLTSVYREQENQKAGQTGFQEERRGDRPAGPETYDPSKYEKNSPSRVFVAALTLAATLLAGWLLIESGTLTIPGLENSSNTFMATDTSQQTGAQSQSGNQTQTQPGTPEQSQSQDQLQQTGQTNESSAAEAEAEDSETDLAAAGGTEQQGAAEGDEGGNTAETQQPVSAERYGLRGAADGGLNGEFTIVVHSFRLKSTVEDLAVQLNQEGYRTVLSESTGADGSRWRLGLGQFPSQESAEEAAQQLPEPYINNYFIEQL